jgi:transposase-like protein
MANNSLMEYQRLLAKKKKRFLAQVVLQETGSVFAAKQFLSEMLEGCEDQKAMRALDYRAALDELKGQR